MSLTILAGGVLAVLVVLFILFRLMWRVAEPNEALVISGLRQHAELEGVGESLGFKIVTGKGTLVLPGIQTVRRLSLDLREAELAIDCVTHQGIPLGIQGVVIFKVGDDYVSIANAARRFLDQQQQMDARVHNVFAGHLRAIVGNMTVEEMIRDREKLTALTRESSGTEMEKLGLIVDSLQIQEIVDPTGYIRNLALPHAAAVSREARIAQAHADREATQAEQGAEALKAAARRDSQIKQAGYQAEIDRAGAEARQSGPLAEATSRQQVVVQETKVAELEEVELQAAGNAQRVRLEAQAESERVRLEAGANAEAARQIGEGEAAATAARGRAQAESARARGLAEADAIKARADALAENQDAVIGQQLAENWPAIVEAAAKPFGAVDQMIVLNGAQGLSEALAQALSQGVAGLQLARNLLAGPGNGSADSKGARGSKDTGSRTPARKEGA